MGRNIGYTYDAWGNITGVYDKDGNPITNPDDVAFLNPLRYRSYYYDDETGLYYLNSRYYNPEWGRFISADAFADTGQGVIATNMYAYCGNNPVNRKDPAGQFWIAALIVTTVIVGCAVTLSGCSAQPEPAPLPYKTADEAAMAFANSTYSSSRYIRHEYSTEIYSRTINGKTTYNYNPSRVGTPHSASVSNTIPKGTEFVAYAHTHPNSNVFSKMIFN